MAVDLSEFHKPQVTLKVTSILEELHPEQREKLEAALADRKIGNKTIAVVVTSWGHPVSEHAVGTWRERHG